jgi:signal transduction histidine kinase
VIDILIDNALRHGRGSVTLLVDGPSVLVVDQGPGISDEHARTVFEEPIDPGAAHGRGLPLARRLAQVDGGSVEIVEARPLRIRYRLVRAPSLRPATDSEPPPGGGKPRGRPNGRE